MISATSSLSSPTACTTSERWAHSRRTAKSVSPAKRWRSTRRLRTALEWVVCAANLRIWPFSNLDPEGFREVSASVEAKRGESERFLIELRKKVEEELVAEAIPAIVTSRVKRAHSIYIKMQRQCIPIEQVYDLLALRIITDSVRNCYAALGVIHKEWPPVPGRIKDFIAIPRPNLYQSLHTYVFGPEGRHFEVQIRTEEMHRIAEEGIAAHWKYKEGRKGMADDDQRVAWMRQPVEWESQVRDSERRLGPACLRASAPPLRALWALRVDIDHYLYHYFSAAMFRDLCERMLRCSVNRNVERFSRRGAHLTYQRPPGQEFHAGHH
jgi:ppGpp synthetase/RelA/SpoT-type nucleotidyltranferase